VVIRGHQWSSEVISGHQRPSVVISGHQRSSEVIRGPQRSSEVIRGHQRSSEVAAQHVYTCSRGCSASSSVFENSFGSDMTDRCSSGGGWYAVANMSMRALYAVSLADSSSVRPMEPKTEGANLRMPYLRHQRSSKVIRASSECHQGVLRGSSERHQSVIRASSECHQSVIRGHQSVTRGSSEGHQTEVISRHQQRNHMLSQPVSIGSAARLRKESDASASWTGPRIFPVSRISMRMRSVSVGM
jgi:hypothetical protein